MFRHIPFVSKVAEVEAECGVGAGEGLYDYLYFARQIGEEREYCERHRVYQVDVDWRCKISSF